MTQRWLWVVTGAWALSACTGGGDGGVSSSNGGGSETPSETSSSSGGVPTGASSSETSPSNEESGGASDESSAGTGSTNPMRCLTAADGSHCYCDAVSSNMTETTCGTSWICCVRATTSSSTFRSCDNDEAACTAALKENPQWTRVATCP